MELDFVNESEFAKWLRRLDSRVRVRVGLLLAASDVPLGMPQGRRITPDHDLYGLRSGSGHRVYYTVVAEPQRTALILAQGNKDSQDQDIARARRRK